MKAAHRSESIQVHVTPYIKRASNVILRRLGLTMSEAVELFLRQCIIEQRLPFAVRAMDAKALAAIMTLDERAEALTHLRSPADHRS